MSDLKPSLIGLDKGLNLQTAKIIAPAGSVLDTLNYEQVDFQGQKRIDGFTRYDGSVLATLDDYYRITLTTPFAGGDGDLVSTSAGLLGVVVDVVSNVVYVAIYDQNAIPAVGEQVFLIVNGQDTAGNVVTAITTGVDSGVTVEQHYTNLLAFDTVLRNKIESLPGPIAGLHWFRDRLYAVAGVTAASLDGTTPTIYPNDILTLNGVDVKVLDAFTLTYTRLLFLASMTPEDWVVTGEEVFRGAVSMGVIANGFEVTARDNIASFFESRNEAQVLEEDGPSGPYDFGWRFVDLGWIVPFEDGISLYGSLPSLNQNIDGLGIQGPTSIAGNNGRPALLTQNVEATNFRDQVNGWKSSQTPSSYFLDPDNLTSVDSTYIYADAYLSWNGTTGAVVADTEVLTEYAATATVEIEL